MQPSTKSNLMAFIGNNEDLSIFPRYPEKITVSQMEALLMTINGKIADFFNMTRDKPRTHLHKCSAELRLIDDCSNELVYGAKCIQSQAFSREKPENKLEPEGISFSDGVRTLYIYRNEHDQSLTCPDLCKISTDILKQKYLTKYFGLRKIEKYLQELNVMLFKIRPIQREIESFESIEKRCIILERLVFLLDKPPLSRSIDQIQEISLLKNQLTKLACITLGNAPISCHYWNGINCSFIFNIEDEELEIEVFSKELVKKLNELEAMGIEDNVLKEISEHLTTLPADKRIPFIEPLFSKEPEESEELTEDK